MDCNAEQAMGIEPPEINDLNVANIEPSDLELLLKEGESFTKYQKRVFNVLKSAKALKCQHWAEWGCNGTFQAVGQWLQIKSIAEGPGTVCCSKKSMMRKCIKDKRILTIFDEQYRVATADFQGKKQTQRKIDLWFKPMAKETPMKPTNSLKWQRVSSPPAALTLKQRVYLPLRLLLALEFICGNHLLLIEYL